MNPLFFIAKRYFFYKKSTHIVNIISWISVTSIAVCTAALIVIASVFNGIDDLIQSMYNAYSPALKVSPKNGKILVLNDTLLAYLNDKTQFQNVSYSITIDALLQKDNTQFICKLQGIDSNFQDKKFATSFLKTGDYLYPHHALKHNILISQSIANALGIDVSMGLAELTLYTSPIKVKSIQLEQELRTAYFITIGEYRIHKDIDLQYCFAPLEIVRELSELPPNQYSNFEIYLNAAQEKHLSQYKTNIQKLLPQQEVVIETKLEQNKKLFAILSSEKLMIFIILSFIIFIAAFNISGTINLLMMEKRKQMYLLKTFGYSTKQIQRILVYCGMLYGFFGLCIGLVMGTGVALLQICFHLVPIQGNFMINYFPVKFNPIDFFMTAGIVMIITYGATQYAIWKLKKELQKNIRF